MRTIALATCLLLPLSLISCDAEASATETNNGSSQSESAVSQVARDIEKVLQGITSPETAESAKSQLGTLIDKLATMIPKMPKGEEGKGMISSLANNAAKAASALGGDFAGAMSGISKQVERLTGNAELAAPLKQAIDKLRGMLTNK